MKNDVIITQINNIIFFDAKSFGSKFSSFKPVLQHNELILHLSGRSSILFDDKVYECEKGTVRYLPKGKHKNYDVHRHEYSDCIDIFFESDHPFCDEAFSLNLQNNVNIDSLFKKAFSLWLSKSDGYYHKCLSIVYEILAELEKNHYAPENKLKIIDPAIDFINENFLKEKISIEVLAEISGISQSYLKKLFIKRFGVTPLKYVIQLKIHYAKDLLLTGVYTIAQVAEICGYNNLYFFSRQFKEYCGVSPFEFKSKHK